MTRNYEYIYGSKVTLQCQAQINPQVWNGQDNYARYLAIINKDKEFFKYWYKIRNAVTCVVEEPPDEDLGEDLSEIVGTHKNAYLKERQRVVSWSMGRNEVTVLRIYGHGKQLLYLPFKTFCAKDQGISFRVPAQTSSGEV
jgi:hypothetical protein